MTISLVTATTVMDKATIHIVVKIETVTTTNLLAEAMLTKGFVRATKSFSPRSKKSF